MTDTNDSSTYFALDVGELKLSRSKGYLYFYMPGHPLASRNGTVPVHRHVMSVHRKQWLGSEEAVMFVNGNREDFKVENLKIVSFAEILKIFAPPAARIELVCAVCGQSFDVAQSQVHRRRHCSSACLSKAQRKFDISPNRLAELVWEMPTTQIAREYGVSDKAVEKRCKKHEISKPPRGYWAKLYAGQIDPILKEEMSNARKSNLSNSDLGERKQGLTTL